MPPGSAANPRRTSGRNDHLRQHPAKQCRATTLVLRVPHPRHRRAAQRRQVHPVQRADPQRRAGRELPVRDDRAERRRGAAAGRAPAELAEMFASARIVPATVSFVDIAGIVKGASEGAGLGNKFLANIRESDAICQVVRVFDDPDVVHVDGRVDPASDIETINTELILADLQTLEKAVPRLEKEARMQKDRRPVLEAAEAAVEILNGGRTLFAAGVDRDAAARAVAADHQAVPLRLQRRRGRAHRRGAAQGAGRAGRARATRCSSTPRSRPSCWSWTRSRPRELLESIGQHEPGLYALARAGLSHPGPADLPDRRPEGVARLDDQAGRDRPAGRRGDPHRLRARVHQGRDRLVRRPGGGRARWPRPRRRARCAWRARTT